MKGLGNTFFTERRHSERSAVGLTGCENGMELFAAFAGLAPARGGRAVALAWKGLRPDAGCSMRFRARRGGGLSAAAAAVDVVSAACGRGSGRVDVVV